MDVRAEALEAEKRIRPHIRETPLEHSPALSELAKCTVYLKLENLQITGSFKLRGAMNSLLALDPEVRERGTVTASSGNHGSAFAYALKTLGLEGKIYLPKNASPAKVQALRSYGADLEFWGDDSGHTEIHAREVADKGNLTYISPYNDPKVIGGQGTIGVELERQLDGIDAVFVPIGGGGLIAGIAGHLKSVDDSIEVIGCQPEKSAVMYESIRAGQIVEVESLPTLSDGTAGAIEPGAITFELCKEHVDDYVVVTEEEIADAIRFVLENHYMLVEGSGALAVACLLKALRLADEQGEGARFEGKNVVLVLSGAKISAETLRAVLG